MNINHIALKVGDLKVCEEFYSGLMGLPVIKRHNDESGNERSVWLDAGGVILMLERADKAVKDLEHGSDWYLVALEIVREDRGVWKNRLRTAGVEITGESDFSIYLSDPEGNKLALSHYKK